MAERINPKYQLVWDIDQVNRYNTLADRDEAMDCKRIYDAIECPICYAWQASVASDIGNFCRECGQRLSGKVAPADEKDYIPFEEMEK